MEQGFGVCDTLTVCKSITEVEQVCEEYACARDTNIKVLATLGDAIYGVPKIRGPQNTTCLMKRTSQKGTPHFGKPSHRQFVKVMKSLQTSMSASRCDVIGA